MCTEITIHGYCKTVDENFVIKYKCIQIQVHEILDTYAMSAQA